MLNKQTIQFIAMICRVQTCNMICFQLCAIEHTYSVSGDYEVTVMLHNSRSSQEVTTIAKVNTVIEDATISVGHVGLGSDTVITVAATSGAT